jgi:hypothetical protein
MTADGRSMKKTTALVFLLAFSCLSVYFFFAQDYCHLHDTLPGATFTHTHNPTASVCLCFWGNLFSPGSCDFACAQDVSRLAVIPVVEGPSKALPSDISHPPELRSA